MKARDSRLVEKYALCKSVTFAGQSLGFPQNVPDEDLNA